MSTKPFSLQSPEQIAKDYSGNKQKIAQAAQMGLVDSTAAVLAGMFIDRMRSAQMLEQQPQQTVAQQVLSPQPQAAPPPAPPQGGAPMGMAGAPPVGGMQQRLGMATQQGGTPVPAPQAAGPGFAEGGLASLPVPDGMFDEPSGGGFNEGYAGGGIVAFAEGGPTPPSFYGLSTDPLANAAMYERVVGPLEGKDREAYREYLSRMRDPGALAAQKKQDLWSTLAQVGFGMAGSNSPYFLQAAGQAGSAAIPGMMQAVKDRKAQEREAIRGMADVESLGNRERQERGGQLFGMSGQARSGLEGQAERAQRAELQAKEIAARERLARMPGGGGGGGGSGGEFGGSLTGKLAGAKFVELRANPKYAAASDASLRRIAMEYAIQRQVELRGADETVEGAGGGVAARLLGPPKQTAPQDPYAGFTAKALP